MKVFVGIILAASCIIELKNYKYEKMLLLFFILVKGKLDCNCKDINMLS